MTGSQLPKISQNNGCCNPYSGLFVSVGFNQRS
nr:MAG TPA: hypothetical protein [Caudoviricetes sp.]